MIRYSTARFAAAVVLLLACFPAAGDQRAPRAAIPPLVVPDGLGVNIHFTNPQPGEVAMLAACGFRFDRRLSAGSAEDYVLLFDRGRETRLAVWTSAAASHGVTIPGQTGRFTVTSYLGAALPPLAAGADGLSVTLADAPQDPGAFLTLNTQRYPAIPVTRAAQPFYAPRPSPLLLRWAKRLAPTILRWRWGIQTVDVSSSDLQRLRALGDQRAIFTPNHPSLAEPAVVWRALRMANVSTYYLASWESFAYFGRFASFLLQRLGCYSVMRGRRDRASMQMTQQLLVQGERIVIFPEGETYGLNDTLLPFQAGVLQMGFRAFEELLKQQVEAPVRIVPVAVRYSYTRKMDDTIHASFRRLEAKLKLQAGDRAPYDRLAQIAEAVVSSLEREHHVRPPEGALLDERITILRDQLLERIAIALHAELPRGARFPDRLRAVYNVYHDLTYEEQDEQPSAYQRGLRRQSATAARPLYAEWHRLHNFIAIRGEYVRESPTQERFLEDLGRLETEVLGQELHPGPRRAQVRIGEPLDLRESLAAYQQDRRDTVAALTREVEARVAAMLAVTPSPARSSKPL